MYNGWWIIAGVQDEMWRQCNIITTQHSKETFFHRFFEKPTFWFPSNTWINTGGSYMQESKSGRGIGKDQGRMRKIESKRKSTKNKKSRARARENTGESEWVKKTCKLNCVKSFSSSENENYSFILCCNTCFLCIVCHTDLTICPDFRITINRFWKESGSVVRWMKNELHWKCSSRWMLILRNKRLYYISISSFDGKSGQIVMKLWQPQKMANEEKCFLKFIQNPLLKLVFERCVCEALNSFQLTDFLLVKNEKKMFPFAWLARMEFASD